MYPNEFKSTSSLVLQKGLENLLLGTAIPSTPKLHCQPTHNHSAGWKPPWPSRKFIFFISLRPSQLQENTSFTMSPFFESKNHKNDRLGPSDTCTVQLWFFLLYKCRQHVYTGSKDCLYLKYSSQQGSKRISKSSFHNQSWIDPVKIKFLINQHLNQQDSQLFRLLYIQNLLDDQ